MTLHVLDEIIDALILNEKRHQARSDSGRPGFRRPPAKWACRPDWMQELPDAGDGGDPEPPGSPAPRGAGVRSPR
jgi:hypothetical protein